MLSRRESRRISVRIPSDTALLLIFWRAVPIFVPYKRCSDTRISPPLRFTCTSTVPISDRKSWNTIRETLSISLRFTVERKQAQNEFSMFNVQRRRGRERNARTKWQCSMFNEKSSMFNVQCSMIFRIFAAKFSKSDKKWKNQRLF